MGVAIGVDSHKSTLAAAALDELGRVLATEEFTNDDRAHDVTPRVGDRPGGGAGRDRGKNPTRGKSDLRDAVAIARVVARGEPLSSPRRADILRDLKLLSDHRDQLVRAKTQTDQPHPQRPSCLPSWV